MMLGMALSNHAVRFRRAVVPDPLEGMAFGYGRLQTHRGDNVPLGLYQDVACTIPAVAEFDLVAAWRDELTESGAVATQADPDKQPLLVFINGVPLLEFDGADDFLSHGEGGAVAASMFAVARNDAFPGYQMLAGFGVPAGPNIYSFLPGATWGGYYSANVSALEGNTLFHTLAQIVRGFNDIDFYTDGSVVTNQTNGTSYDSGTGSCIGAEVGGASGFMHGHIGAVMAGPHTDYDHAAVRSYLNTIFTPVIGI